MFVSNFTKFCSHGQNLSLLYIHKIAGRRELRPNFLSIVGAMPQGSPPHQLSNYRHLVSIALQGINNLLRLDWQFSNPHTNGIIKAFAIVANVGVIVVHHTFRTIRTSDAGFQRSQLTVGVCGGRDNGHSTKTLDYIAVLGSSRHLFNELPMHMSYGCSRPPMVYLPTD